MTKYTLSVVTGLMAVALTPIFPAVAQHGDTQSVGVTLTARPAMYNKSMILDYFQNQQFEDAIGYLSPILQADSANLTLLGYAGYAYYMNDNTRAAAQCYQHMLVLDSNNVTALHYLVLIRYTDDPEGALALATRLVTLQPEREPWWRIMAEQIGRASCRERV